MYPRYLDIIVFSRRGWDRDKICGDSSFSGSKSEFFSSLEWKVNGKFYLFSKKFTFGA